MTDEQIFNRARDYSEGVYNQLVVNPIQYVEARVAANSHRMGYVKGAEEVRTFYQGKISHLKKVKEGWFVTAMIILLFWLITVVALIIAL